MVGDRASEWRAARVDERIELVAGGDRIIDVAGAEEQVDGSGERERAPQWVAGLGQHPSHRGAGAVDVARRRHEHGEARHRLEAVRGRRTESGVGGVGLAAESVQLARS